MDNVITQFMWGYQRHFMVQVHVAVQFALEAIGFAVEPVVILVGFSADSNVEHPICVEPETGPLSSDDLKRVPTLADELYAVNLESKLFHSHPLDHEAKQNSVRLDSRADALRKAIHASFAHPDMTFLVSLGSPIGGYHVHTCVGVPSAPLEALPALPDEVVDRFYAPRSLQHAVVRESLRRADMALYLPDPGVGAGSYSLGTTSEIVASAAEGLTQGMAFRATGRHADVFRSVNELASLGYERAGASGRLLFTKRNSSANSLRVQFERPVRLSKARSMRKLLQLTDDTHAVLVDDGGAFGLGDAEAGPNCAEIEITGHAEWEASIDRQKLVRVSYGKATLPTPPLDRDKVKDALERQVEGVDFDRIWTMIEAAQDCGHGMTLVVTSDPEGEIDRLGREAVPIEAELMSPTDLVRFGRVDGAVMLGPDGSCYGFGVILDGIATGHGDPARGSRFNSAVRYQRTVKAGSTIIVISDDGTVDLIPDLMPRIARAKVEAAVQEFHACCNQEEVDRAEFVRTYDQVRGLKFYLDDEQCELVNSLHEREEARWFAESGFRISQSPLQPNPEMDESYFL